MKKISLPIIILIFISSCEEETKPLEFEIVSIENTYEADIEVTFDKAKVNSEIAKNINSHIDSAILKNVPFSREEEATSIEEALKDFDEQYKSFKNNFGESAQTWSLAIETEILYKTENIVTMGLSVYSDTGGAHGNDSIQFLNFNPENGALLTQNDIISDMKGFKKLAESFFLDHMKNEGLDIKEFFFGKPFQLPENIGFNEEGIILLYNNYEIASYAQGYTEFVISIEKAKEFLSF
ncbi:MAG: DUF4163 domain-containing protein [Winogradskyella sp.]|uniref:DUF3298 and DUF4163 domain-containing protein n=1 Tax=Winogradskyella sp. TaxID=1883156 RepID=UPI0017E0744F|nr:DUF3298 and DUF4163 domain-containing protein [Winogradskyella sp.]MBT8245991.1 DUF3298 and DUF4163 domain-containing protein [Winogradskyella sp.]NNK22363.1 DUF4163 domain-containing protein [Winogradskyella sp.]